MQRLDRTFMEAVFGREEGLVVKRSDGSSTVNKNVLPKNDPVPCTSSRRYSRILQSRFCVGRIEYTILMQDAGKESRRGLKFLSNFSCSKLLDGGFHLNGITIPASACRTKCPTHLLTTCQCHL